VYFLSLTLSTQVVGKIVPFTICSLNKNKCGSESVIVLVLTSSSSLVVLVVVVAVMVAADEIYLTISFPSQISVYFRLAKRKRKKKKSNTTLGMFIVDISNF